jgi:type II secretory ATPase GspE/PulE/Tfp pilus assembly ATPase PilB-like protein
LSHLNEEGRKILTVEDPIEYNLASVEQVQVHEEIGMSFAKALRAFLRQDPNVIMVGEIRDEETAEIACRAALVGRMVLSTLHTNSPEGALTRLVDLGVPEYIVRDVLRGVLGQKLVGDGERGLVLTARLTR